MVIDTASRVTAVALVAILISSGALAQEAAPVSRWLPIAPNSIFETGDTWVTNGQRFRLYGVQSCLRGTAYTGPDGQKHDCGGASLRMLVGLIRTWSPLCAPIARDVQADATFVVCYADATTPRGVLRIELGTALIASGFAFAALDAKGRPVHFPYVAAENAARTSKAGLWGTPDLPHPNAILFKALPAAKPTP